MHPQKFLKRIIYQTFTLLLIALFSGTATFSYSQQPHSESELGIAPYPNASYLPESTRRIQSGKAPTWMAVTAYHSDDSIENLAKYFKKKAKEAKFPKVSNPIIKTLLRGNWAIDNYGTMQRAPTIFQFAEEVRTSKGDVKVKRSFGIFVLSDSIVRVHLITPYPSEDNSELMSGTMIVLVRERVLPKGEWTISNQGSEIYKGHEVTSSARIVSRPEPQYTKEARANGIEGTVVLRGVFAASGKLENISVVSGLPNGLTESAIKTARKIKFEPAVKDGRYVSMYIQIEYNFNLY